MRLTTVAVVCSLKVGPAYRFTVASRLQCCMLQGIGELCRKVRINRHAIITCLTSAGYNGRGHGHLAHGLNIINVTYCATIWDLFSDRNVYSTMVPC